MRTIRKTKNTVRVRFPKNTGTASKLWNIYLSIVIVSYNTRELLQSCLESLSREVRGIDFEVIVVDNGSADGTVAMVRSQFPRVRIVANTRNLGFAAANNLGMKESRGAFVLYLNPDVEVLPGVFTRTLEYMREHPEVGVLGCKILNRDGSVQQSARELPTLWTLLLENTYLYRQFSHSGVFRNPWITDVEKEQEVDVVKGAFLLIRRDVLDQVGGMDEQFFLYSEEQDLCLRVKQGGWKVVYSPIAGIVHVEGGSSLPGANSAKLFVFDSEYKYFKKHYGVLYAKGACLIMLVGSLMRIIAWSSLVGVRILKGRDVVAAKARVLSYWYSLGRLLSILVHFRNHIQAHVVL